MFRSFFFAFSHKMYCYELYSVCMFVCDRPHIVWLFSFIVYLIARLSLFFKWPCLIWYLLKCIPYLRTYVQLIQLIQKVHSIWKKKREEYCGKRERELEIRTLNGSERYLFVQNASHNQKRNEQVEPALSISVGVETEQFTCVLFFCGE